MKHLPTIISPPLTVEVEGVKFDNTSEGWAAAFAKEKESEYISEAVLIATGNELHGVEQLDISSKNFSKVEPVFDIKRPIRDVDPIRDVKPIVEGIINE